MQLKHGKAEDLYALLTEQMRYKAFQVHVEVLLLICVKVPNEEVKVILRAR